MEDLLERLVEKQAEINMLTKEKREMVSVEKVVTEYKNVFVYFYIPFCSHEKPMTSTFNKAYNKFYKKKV